MLFYLGQLRAPCVMSAVTVPRPEMVVLDRFEGTRDADWKHRTPVSITEAPAKVLVELSHPLAHAGGRRVGSQGCHGNQGRGAQAQM